MSEAVRTDLLQADVRRVEGGVWLRVVLASVGASGVISVDDAKCLAGTLLDAAERPAPKAKGGK